VTEDYDDDDKGHKIAPVQDLFVCCLKANEHYLGY